MKTRVSLILMFAMLAAALAYSAYVYPTLPERVPVHWNIEGKPDGWGPKWVDLFLAPGVMAFMILLAVGLPYLSPKNFKIEPFMGSYNAIMTILVGLFAYIHVVIIQAVIRPDVDMVRWLIGGMMLFFAAMGNLMGQVRRNFWMGIRTPWTLASDAVWVATHRLAARLMAGFGLVGAAAVLLGVPPLFVFLPFFGAVLYPVLYSFLLYKQMERAGTV